MAARTAANISPSARDGDDLLRGADFPGLHFLQQGQHIVHLFAYQAKIKIRSFWKSL
jgi:hypothetical protein